jgi:hypothetical protein
MVQRDAAAALASLPIDAIVNHMNPCLAQGSHGFVFEAHGVGPHRTPDQAATARSTQDDMGGNALQ